MLLGLSSLSTHRLSLCTRVDLKPAPIASLAAPGNRHTASSSSLENDA